MCEAGLSNWLPLNLDGILVTAQHRFQDSQMSKASRLDGCEDIAFTTHFYLTHGRTNGKVVDRSLSEDALKGIVL